LICSALEGSTPNAALRGRVAVNYHGRRTASGQWCRAVAIADAAPVVIAAGVANIDATIAVAADRSA
jgi:hypothetical protein